MCAACVYFKRFSELVEQLDEQTVQNMKGVVVKAQDYQKFNYKQVLTFLNAWPHRRGDWIPTEVAQLAVALSALGSDGSVYCAYLSGWNIAVQANRIASGVYAELENISTTALSNLLNDGHIEIRQGDPVRSPSWVDGYKLMQFDVGFYAGPWRMKRQGERQKQRYLTWLKDELARRIPELHRRAEGGHRSNSCRSGRAA